MYGRIDLRMLSGGWWRFAIGAGFRQPFQLRDNFRGELDAVRLDLLSIFIDIAETGMDIQMSTGNLCFDNSTFSVDGFLKTA